MVKRLVIAILVGFAAIALSYVELHARGFLASDFEWPLVAARAVVAGHNPYTAAQPGAYPLDSVFFYPIMTALAAVPFAPFSDYWAGALFFGASSGLLAFAAYPHGWRYAPLFLSAPYFISAGVAQWSPLMMAAALLPWPAAFIFTFKPNLGAAGFLYRPSWRAVIVMAGAGIIGLLIMPDWPLYWLHGLMTGQGDRYTAPLLAPGGIVLALAVLAWRIPEGRFLLISALIPSHPYFYDRVPLWLVPRTWPQALLLSASSWIAYFGWLYFTPTMAPADLGLYLNAAWPWQTALIYLPALAITLWPVLYEMWAKQKDHSHTAPAVVPLP